MTTEELATKLRDTCLRAPKGDKVVMIHLFGIRYAEHLEGHNLKELAVLAGESDVYGTELRKGMRLAEYVQLR